MKEQDEIEQLFSSNFDGFEKAPPADVKAAIDASLFSGGATTESKKRKGIIWWFVFALVIGVTGLGSIIFFTNRTNDVKASNLHAQNTSENENSSSPDTSINSVRQNKVPSSNSTKTKSSTKKTNSEETSGQMKAVSSHPVKKEQSAITSSTTTKKKKNATNDKHNLKKKSGLIDNDLKSKSAGTSLTGIISAQTKMTEDEPSNLQLDSDLNKKTISEENSNSSKESSADLASTETKIDSTSSEDSSKMSIALSPDPTITSLPKAKTSPFSLTLFSGATYGLSTLQQPTSSSFKMKEEIGFSSSIEMNYALTNRFELGAGIDINTRMDNFYRVSQVTDSVYLGLVPQYVYDPQVPDSIIDTLYVEEYDVVNNEIEQNQLIRHTSFAIPLIFNWNIYSSGRWNYRLGTVVRLAYVNNKLVSNDHNFEMPEFKKFSARIALRPQVDYTFNKIAIGAYLNCGYDLLPTVNWTDIERKRVDFGAGLLIRYKF